MCNFDPCSIFPDRCTLKFLELTCNPTNKNATLPFLRRTCKLCLVVVYWLCE